VTRVEPLEEAGERAADDAAGEKAERTAGKNSERADREQFGALARVGRDELGNRAYGACKRAADRAEPAADQNAGVSHRRPAPQPRHEARPGNPKRTGIQHSAHGPDRTPQRPRRERETDQRTDNRPNGKEHA